MAGAAAVRLMRTCTDRRGALGSGAGHLRPPGSARRPDRTAGRRLGRDPDGAQAGVPARDLDPGRVRARGRDRRRVRPDSTATASAPTSDRSFGALGCQQSPRKITRTGNGHVRRLLIEASVYHMHLRRQQAVDHGAVQVTHQVRGRVGQRLAQHAGRVRKCEVRRHPNALFESCCER